MDHHSSPRPYSGSYMPVYVAPLTSARHPTPPNSRTALYTVVVLPSRPLQIGLAVHLHLLASPLQLGRDAFQTVMVNSTVVPLAIAGCIVGTRACEAGEAEFVIMNDHRSAYVQRAFLRVQAIHGVSVDLDIGLDLSWRLDRLLHPPPLVPRAPPVQHQIMQSLSTRAHIERYVSNTPTHCHPSSYIMSSRDPSEASGSMLPPPPPSLPRCSRASFPSPSQSWHATPRSTSAFDEEVPQDLSMPMELNGSHADAGREDGAPVVDSS